MQICLHGANPSHCYGPRYGKRIPWSKIYRPLTGSFVKFDTDVKMAEMQQSAAAAIRRQMNGASPRRSPGIVNCLHAYMKWFGVQEGREKESTGLKHERHLGEAFGKANVQRAKEKKNTLPLHIRKQSSR